MRFWSMINHFSNHDSNVVMGCVDSGIRTDSAGVVITNNIVGNVYQFQLWMPAENANNNFADDQMPAGIMTEETNDVIISGNRVAGVDGSCFSGHGSQCSSTGDTTFTISPDTSRNMGHSCLRGYYVFRKGYLDCTAVSDFILYKTAYYGITMTPFFVGRTYLCTTKLGIW